VSTVPAGVMAGDLGAHRAVGPVPEPPGARRARVPVPANHEAESAVNDLEALVAGLCGWARDHDQLSTAPAELLMEHEFWHPGGDLSAFRLATTRRAGQ
jgi:hypothetical protein